MQRAFETPRETIWMMSREGFSLNDGGHNVYREEADGFWTHRGLSTLDHNYLTSQNGSAIFSWLGSICDCDFTSCANKKTSSESKSLIALFYNDFQATTDANDCDEFLGTMTLIASRRSIRVVCITHKYIADEDQSRRSRIASSYFNLLNERYQ